VGKAFQKPVRITTHLECEGDHDDLHPNEDAPSI
jgi:hypothetical protein